MNFVPFSRKQLRVLTWWCKNSPDSGRDAIICDGAVRSGKTLCMSVSFVLWAFSRYSGQAFAFCGKTIASLRRNVILPLTAALEELGFSFEEKVSRNTVTLAYKGRSNLFYLFGGRDESAAALIQGVTLAGVLLDEAALMPRSFVEQALARCSVPGSRLWFNCNPEHPFHWFYEEWIKKSEQKNALYLHFTMEDNPALPEEIKKRYRALYSGPFYERFVEGRWTAAAGVVYPMFSEKRHVVSALPAAFERYVVSCDYGTVNPASFGLWGKSGPVWYRIREYYYDSRKEGALRTDEEHYAALETLLCGLRPEKVLVDPSAASFLECIRRHGRYRAVPAKNDLLGGIRRVSDALREGRLLFSADCRDSIREFSLYIWDQNSGEDRPVKEHDHAMDEIRYFVNSELAAPEDDFFALSLSR
ncbi:MAG: PBSX family phage terminase large subunit [Oscillospiraceae bacterium]|nr:PBSX family phage terminase large subunit [Oscillospiraceae bacterium]